jgi:hypothetical protein
MTRHPAREPAHPFTDPTDWRDELDDLRRMLAEAGRTGPLRDEIAALLHEAGRGDRITVALLKMAASAAAEGNRKREAGELRSSMNFLNRAVAYNSAAMTAEVTQ